MNPYSKYLPSSKTCEPWKIYLNNAGYNPISPESLYPSVEHPESYHFSWENGRILEEYQLVFIESGSGDLETEAHSWKGIQAPFAFLLFPGVWHRYRPDYHMGWTEHWIGFRGAYMEALCESGIFTPSRPVFVNMKNSGIALAFQQVHSTLNEQATGFEVLSSGLCIQLLALLYQGQFTQASVSHMALKIREAKRLMEREVDHNIRMEAIASELACSYSHFRKLFREITGFSPKQYYQALRLERLKGLLQFTDNNLSEIADHMHFDSAFHLSSFFKLHTGSAPGCWRKR